MQKRAIKIFACAGESSGDRILAQILEMLKMRLNNLEIKGLGGHYSNKQGLNSLAQVRNIAVNGIGDVLYRLPFFLRLLHLLKREMKKWDPDIVILIDFPGLNLRLLKFCRKLSFPVYYICPPQAWAYKSRDLSRFNGTPVQITMPQDVPLYRAAGAVVCQGHFFNKPISIPSNRSQFLLCPGSRLPVLKRNLPFFIQMVEQIIPIEKRSRPVLVLVPAELEKDALNLINKEQPSLKWSLITESESAFSLASHALAFPGSVTAELALWCIPTLVLGIVEPLTWLTGKIVLKTRWTALPNAICGKELFPEVLSWRNPPKKLIQAKMLHIFKNGIGFSEFSNKLGPAKGLIVACENILKLVNPIN